MQIKLIIHNFDGICEIELRELRVVIQFIANECTNALKRNQSHTIPYQAKTTKQSTQHLVVA